MRDELLASENPPENHGQLLTNATGLNEHQGVEKPLAKN